MEGKVIEGSQFKANELMLAKHAAELLHKHYPGHLWGVNVEGPFLDVRNFYLAGEWGFRLSIPAIYSASELDARIMRAGGEILERYRQRRGAVDEASVHTLTTDFAGRHKPEL
jgi:hypothetical protein